MTWCPRCQYEVQAVQSEKLVPREDGIWVGVDSHCPDCAAWLSYFERRRGPTRLDASIE